MWFIIFGTNLTYVYILHGNDEALGWAIFVMYKLQSDIKESQDPVQYNEFIKK